MTSFNEQQLQAIHHLDGPMIVIAGPGSGKTTVTTNRIRYLTMEAGVLPCQIVAITFTKKAADEMRTRFQKLTGCVSTDVTFGTFHSVFLSVLREYLTGFQADLVSPTEAISLLKSVCSMVYPNLKLSSDYFYQLLSEISKVKNGFRIHNPLLERILPLYNQSLYSRNKLDFDDMLTLCAQLLKRDQSVLNDLRNRYQYLMLDEFQDINRIQFCIIRMLAGPRENLFVVGDDDQSIYGFRGSDPSIMLRFTEIYPKAKIVRLLTNYRSSERIVQSASRLISHNKERYEKELSAHESGGTAISVAGFETVEDEALAVIKILQERKEGETAAVLYRTHRAGLPIAEQILLYDRQHHNARGVSNVQMMTFHASKGLEFDVVLIVEAGDHITPGRKRDAAELEEERRMFYVAMTRAKKVLHIFYTDYGYNKHCKRSRYINEI